MGCRYARYALVSKFFKWLPTPSDENFTSGTQFRKHRRLSQALLNPQAARGYTTMHEEVAATLLSSLLKHPDKFRDHILV